MTPMRLVSLSALLCCAVATPVRAQNLLALYEAASAYDAAFQSAQAQYAATLARADQAFAGLLPTVNLTAGYTESQYKNYTPFVARDIVNQTAAIAATQPLYRPGNLVTWEQALKQKVQARVQFDNAAQDLIIRVSQAYFDVLAATDTLAFVRAQKAAVAEQLASAKRNFEVGTATITDTREAEARFDLVRAQEIAAENDLRVKRLALDTLVGKSNTEPVPLRAPLNVAALEPADLQNWISRSEDVAPSVQQARLAFEIARLEVDKARATGKPTVDLTVQHSQTRTPNGTNVTAVGTRNHTSSIGVNFVMPLFAGYAIENRIKESIALQTKAEADLEATRRTVAQGVRSAYFGVVSGVGQVRALEAAESSSQLALDANKLGYQVGVRINIDVLNAQSQLFQTKRDLSVARYNVLLGGLRLRQAAGTLSAEDLQQVNAALGAAPAAAKP